ncbi:MAG: ccpM [Anaerocolumna sp.]|jgi:uncharacterized protein|nr:ccpM [Anaerocolumna sp.]
MVQQSKQPKPLILLYKTPLGFYFYETNRNEIVSVNEPLYNYIDAVMKDIEQELQQTKEEVISQYQELVDCGYLLTNRVKEIKHPATDNLELFLERKIDSITLQVTQNCNLRCSYCVYSESNYLSQRSHSDKRMTFETAKKAVDFYFAHSIDTKGPNISFYGGEPFLNLELIQQVVEYAKKVFEGRPLTFTTTTNATLLTNELIDYLAENKFNLMISLDGPKSIHNQNRVFAANNKGSYDTVVKNIKRLWERQPEFAKTVSTNMVINPENSYEEINSLFHDKYIKKMRANHSIVEKEDDSVQFSSRYTNGSFYNQFLGVLSTAKRFKKEDVKRTTIEEIMNMQYQIQKIKYGVLGDTAAPGGPCIPGKMRLFIDYRGDFYPCERVSETSACMHLGSLTTGFEMNNVYSVLNIGKLTEEDCKNCWAFIHCMICGKKVDEDGELSAEKKRKACKESKGMAFSKIKNKTLLFELNKHLSNVTMGE